MAIRPFIGHGFVALMLGFLAVGIAFGTENYTARAELRDADGNLRTAPITISLDRILTTSERDTLIAAFQTEDNATLKKALASQATIGYVEGRQTRVPIKYAFPRPTSGGRILTIVCNEPITHIGGDMPGAKPKAGFDLTFILLVLDANGKGTGEISPAAKLKLREDGALVTEEYGAVTIWLSDVARK